MKTHEHVWLRQAQHSGRSFERFRCDCGAWAHRSIKAGTLGPITAYAHGWTPPPPPVTAWPAGTSDDVRREEDARRS